MVACAGCLPLLIFSVDEIWVFVSVAVILLSFSGMVAIAACVTNLNLNLFLSKENQLFLMPETYCKVFHILCTNGYFP